MRRKEQPILYAIGSILLIGLLIYTGITYYQLHQTDTKLQQYETYLSNAMVRDLSLLSNNILTFTDISEFTVEAKKLDEEHQSILAGQLFETLEIAYSLENLAIATENFNNSSPAFYTTETAYAIGMYVSNLLFDKEFSETELANMKMIHNLFSEWKNVIQKVFPELDNTMDIEAYFMKDKDELIRQDGWSDLINGLDQATTAWLKEKNVPHIAELLFPKQEEKEASQEQAES